MGKLKKQLYMTMGAALCMTGLIPAQMTHAATDIRSIMLTDQQIRSLSASDWSTLISSNVTDIVMQLPSYNSITPLYTQETDAVTDMGIISSNDPYVNVWLSTPGIDMNNYPQLMTDVTNDLSDFESFVNYVKSNVSNWYQVRGIYQNEESIYSSSMNYSNLRSNPEVELMYEMQEFVHQTLGLQYLWMPYYGYGSNAGTINQNIGYVADGIQIYDYCMIQPHYYWSGLPGYPVVSINNLTSVENSVLNQHVEYTNGTFVTTKVSSTQIGAEFELNHYITGTVPVPDVAISGTSPVQYEDQQPLQRWNDEVHDLKGLVGAYPLGFYWDGNFQNTMNSYVKTVY